MIGGKNLPPSFLIHLTSKSKPRYYENQMTLVVALGQLIACRNKASRNYRNTPILIGKNFFVPFSITYEEDVRDLYHQYNIVTSEMLDYCDREILPFRSDPKRELAPVLPPGFREASGAAARWVCMRKEFNRLMRSIEHNPWKTMDVKRIIERAKGDIRHFKNEEDEHRFINNTCFERIGHFW